MRNELVRDLWNEVIAKGHTSPAKVKEIVDKHLKSVCTLDEVEDAFNSIIPLGTFKREQEKSIISDIKDYLKL